jgi:hypothetical protein
MEGGKLAFIWRERKKGVLDGEREKQGSLILPTW